MTVKTETIVCPLDERQINFTIGGEGVFLGGYNSGVGDRIVNHKDYVFAECGINRVFVRSTRNSGTVTLTATADGVESASVEIPTVELALTGGLTPTARNMQEVYISVVDGGNPILKEIDT